MQTGKKVISPEGLSSVGGSLSKDAFKGRDSEATAGLISLLQAISGSWLLSAVSSVGATYLLCSAAVSNEPGQ